MVRASFRGEVPVAEALARHRPLVRLEPPARIDGGGFWRIYFQLMVPMSLPIFVVALTQRQASMYPPKAYAGKDSPFISKNPIGTGPYRLVRWSKDGGAIFVFTRGTLRIL